MSGGLHHVEHVMGMAVSIDVREPLPPLEAITDAVAWLHHVDDTFSTYIDDSEISRFGRGEISISELSNEVQGVLLRCIELTDITEGAFDAFAVPAPNGTHLDPSGYVKGWAIERATAMLEAAGAANFCINAGGDIALRGTADVGEPWRIGIRHPDHADKIALAIELSGPTAIATSATYERGAHIVDPRTGEAVTDLASVTIIGPDLSTADAYATAVFVMGIDGLEWIERQRGYEAYVISHEGTTHWTREFPHPHPAAPLVQRSSVTVKQET